MGELTEYIERNAAITTALDAVEIHPSQAGCLKEALAEIPAADVRPVTQGQWKVSTTETGEFWANYCSICGAYVPYGMEWEPNFCPACGADMREANRRATNAEN